MPIVTAESTMGVEFNDRNLSEEGVLRLLSKHV